MSTPADHPAALWPSWLARSAIAVTVIVGPPGNGARRYIDAHAAPGDIVIDVNAIMVELSGLPPSAPGRSEWIIPAMTRRNAALGALARLVPKPDEATAAWVISPSPFAWQRTWWADRLGATVQLLDPGRAAAITGARAEGVPEKYVHQWYAESAGGAASGAIPAARPRAGDDRESASARGYNARHRALRDKQLAREPWCRFCWEERQVKVPATVLDHIEPFMVGGVFSGKLWGDPKNHRSLCGPCHNSRGAQRNRPEKAPGAGIDGKPLDPAHPWNRK